MEHVFRRYRSILKPRYIYIVRNPIQIIGIVSKNSISAVEAAVRIISENSKAELGDALKIMDASKPIHGAFKQALLKLYGYTSDEGGIRHSLLKSTNIDESDARFMLVTCSAFVNYFISRS